MAHKLGGLPKGGKLLAKLIKKQIAGWVEMAFDAKVICHGVVWLRVKDGMGGRRDREDWVADLNASNISVHDYEFRAPYWGLWKFSSFEAACRDGLERQVGHLQRKIDEKLNDLEKAKADYKTITEILRGVKK